MAPNARTLVLFLALFIDVVWTECSTGCTSCSGAGSTCSECEPPYYLDGSICSRCPEYCNSCNGLWDCTSCIENKWNLPQSCMSDCDDKCSNGTCRDDNGYCVQCKPGLYGLRCQHNCSYCAGGFCDLHRCTQGCKPGYYELKTEHDSLCQNCPTDCKYCKNGSICHVCDDGFHLHQFLLNGKTFVYCIKCSKESICSNYCNIQNCNECQVNGDSLMCKDCSEGQVFNGTSCILNSINCSLGCSTFCDNDGICLGKCKDGWTGENCTNKCANKCLSCEKSNGNICLQCKGDYYTSNCTIACSPSCTIEQGKQTCRVNDGYCLNGCQHNVWGVLCNMSCSNGCADDDISPLCEISNGTCTNGCKDGYTGEKCDITVTSKATGKPEDETTPNSSDGKRAEEKDDQNIIIIGAAAGGSTIVLLLVVILIVCLVKRRRKPSRDESVQNGMVRSDDKANMQALPVSPGQVQQKEDYIYAQPDKSHMRKKQSKMEISKPQKMYDNIAIDLDENEATVTVNETDVDKIQLEELEEGPTTFIETEVKPPSTDLYYNTASLIRSRIQVSDLLEYIKKKNDYEKEFEKLPKGLTRTCDVALKRNNRAKNRYNGIYAYDATRVVLQSKNYINANYIDGHKASPAYIASLGPTKSTMSDFQDFWEMIWQERTDKIIMLTNLEESKKMKCEQYWPEQGGTKKYGKYKVTCAAERKISEFTVREFTINAKSETRQVTQYHYTAWPDKSVPDGVATLLEFRDKVEQSQTTNAGPMVVHCSAGIGRTGTYIALDILIKEGKDDNYVDFFGCVMALRGQRAHMVQNLDQYIFLHPCVLYALNCDAEPLSLTSIPNIMADEKISRQYQTFTDIQVLVDKDRRSVANNKSRKGNRSGADIPSDDHRVRLTLTLAGHDYINAVYVNGYEKSNKFILAQTPLPNTVEDFVSMLYQEKCPCIVCLDEENIKDKTVGHYLPHAGNVSRVGHFQVTCKTCDSKEDIVIRELRISRNGSQSSQEFKIKHYQLRGWSKSGSVPSRVEPFIKMVRDVENERKVQKSEQPIVVHCLTGAERSGLFGAVSVLSEKLQSEKELSVLNTICQVRTRRRSAFHDIEHYRFCYKCVKEMSETSDSSTYYNMNNM